MIPYLLIALALVLALYAVALCRRAGRHAPSPYCGCARCDMRDSSYDYSRLGGRG